MLEKLSEKFSQQLINSGIISEEDYDIYTYGFFQLIMMILNISTSLALGIVFKLLIPCILLNIAFIPLRINAGGYHADSPVRCYVNSTAIIALLLAIIKWVSFPIFVPVIMVIVSSILIWFFAPVDTADNPCNEIEKVVYGKRIKITLIIETIVFAVCVIFSQTMTVKTIALGILAESFMLIVGMVKNYYIKKAIK